MRGNGRLKPHPSQTLSLREFPGRVKHPLGAKIVQNEISILVWTPWIN